MRATIGDEIGLPDSGFSSDNAQLLKFHGILEKHLQTVIGQLNRANGITTLGAAGDVLWNVIPPPVADIDPRFYRFGSSLLTLADRINKAFAPGARGYRNLWVEGVESSTPSDEDVEPFYSTGHLPRKFKIAIATEFGIIGSGLRRYDVYIGANRLRLRLNFNLECDVATEDLVRVISRLLTRWKRHRFPVNPIS